MKLSAELLTQFAKITNDNKKVDKSSTTYGTAREIDGVMYVQMDGSELLTPASATTDMKDGDRVTVTIKDHTAMATGNISSPAARTGDVQAINSKVDTVNSNISTINSNITTIDSKIRTQDSTISTIDSNVKTNSSDISTLKSTVETQGSTISTIDSTVKTHDSDISTLKSTVETQGSTISTIDSTVKTHDSSINNIGTKVDNQGSSITNIQSSIDTQNTNISAINSSIDVVNSAFKIENNEITGLSKVVTDTLVADKAFVGSLIANDIVTETLKTKFIQSGFANIDVAEVEKLFADSGMITDLVMVDGHVTGKLTGVTINGELINAGTLKANRILLDTNEGLFYELNAKALANADLAIPTDPADVKKICDGLDGAIINDKTLTVDKVYVTDLYSFGATIGGFSITDSAIHSNLKPTMNTSSPGIFLGKDGQIAIGDNQNAIKYYKVDNGDGTFTWKLAISADSIKFSTTNKTVEETIQDSANSLETSLNENIQETVNNLEIGGRNYLLDSAPEQYTDAETRAEFLKTTFDLAPFFDEKGLIEVTLGFDLYSPVEGDIQVYCQNGSGSRYSFSKIVQATTEWKRYFVTFTPTGPNEEFTESFLAFYGTYDTGRIPHVRNLKLEIGNKATDWSPAPEDTDNAIAESETNYSESLGNLSSELSDKIIEAKDTADTAIAKNVDLSEKVSELGSSITMLKNSISSLVTGANGESLMEQTEDGWTFSIQKLADNFTETKENATSDSATYTDEKAAELKESLDNLSDKVSCIKIKTIDGQPCIELSTENNNFKLLITNTEIKFMDGETSPASISNEKLNIEKAEVKDELRFGSFVWAKHGNGNMGLMWKPEQTGEE